MHGDDDDDCGDKCKEVWEQLFLGNNRGIGFHFIPL